MDTNGLLRWMTFGDVRQETDAKWLILCRRRRMGIEPTHRGLNPEHWI
jgi:hypothetical protein